MTQTVKKLSTRGKILAGIVAGIGAIGAIYTWSSGLADNLITTETERQALEQHHDQDIASVLDLIAQEKKNDRVQRNHRELSRLQRDLVGEKFSNEGEKLFMVEEIRRLEKELLCDEKGVCLE